MRSIGLIKESQEAFVAKLVAFGFALVGGSTEPSLFLATIALASEYADIVEVDPHTQFVRTAGRRGAETGQRHIETVAQRDTRVPGGGKFKTG